MANVRKRISELTALESASLDTTLVGVDGGTTYKIELDTLADAVTSRVNILDRDRLSSLESVTSSFETKGRSVISSSAQITTLGFVSESVDITSLNLFTSSQLILNTAFNNGIGARLQTSSFNDFSASVDSRIIAATNEQSLTHLVNTSSFNQYTASISTASLVDRLNQIENLSGSWIAESETGSFLTSLNGAISSSSQLTSSYDVRYVLSGSITQTTWDNIANKPSDIVSSSTQILDLGFVTGSYAFLTEFNSLTQSFNIISGSVVNITNAVDVVQLNNTTQSLNQFTQSIDGRVDSLENATGSYLTSLNGALSSSSQLTSSLDTRYTLSGSVEPLPSNLVSSSAQITAFGFISSSQTIDTSSFATTGSNSFNGNQTITGSLIVSSVAVVNGGVNIPTGSVITLTSGSSISVDASGAITGSLTGSVFGIGDVVAFSSSVNNRINNITIPTGTISGSSQLTSSFDTRYTLSGSVVSGTTPAGTISGSSQLTSSFDGRYVQTGSFNTLTASFNSFTASAQSVTTGSNSFNGTQTITGSLIITTGSFIGSQILANTSSLYLTSGSNIYVQNNGVVEITGSLKVNGITRFETVGGDEGGEIEFGVPQTNTTLSTRVVQDIFQNRLRIFDGNTKGVFIDLSKAPIGVTGEITWKSSGYVDAGTFVQLDNIKATVTTSGNRGLSIGAVSTNFTANIGGTFSNSAGAGGNSTQNITYTTTASTSVFGWNFIAEADTSTYIINDKTNSRIYRITMMIGPAYLGNFISIERLH